MTTCSKMMVMLSLVPHVRPPVVRAIFLASRPACRVPHLVALRTGASRSIRSGGSKSLGVLNSWKLNMNKEIEEEEFGDDSFLNDFDVDAAVVQSGRSPQKPKPFVSPAAAPKRPAEETDEFGIDDDDAFLDNFDVDAAVGAAVKTPGDSPARKRAKVTPEAPRRVVPTTELTDCLQRYFGFDAFRPGQEDAIHAILGGRDVAIFWATGSGKSLTYHLPPLFLNKIGLVVSPLISLMQDQVHKLNALSSTKLATYLGSAQMDPQEEGRALRGEYKLIFVTPEKLQTPTFLDKMARLDLCLVAIDESHCVSDWGHDFRPEYRQAGTTLRNHPQLSQIPIIALTATAVPRVQEDVVTNLRMKDPFLSKKSFDRPNLKIRVLPKGGSSALLTAMESLAQALAKKSSSTIVYASTKAQVEEICDVLQQRLQAQGSPVSVEYYHGGLSSHQRHATHLNFLTGKTAVVVATVAFGLGIDKQDTRRIIHYGPPKTVEEYYQQIGRAGRDGLPAECIMYASPTDFDRYLSDFYIGQLKNEAREASIKSTKALKAFALNNDICRRRALLEEFNETPSFGQHCGTCDVCNRRAHYGEDSSRDFGSISRIILKVVSSLNDPGMSVVTSVLSGKVVEDYRYKRNAHGSVLRDWVANEKRLLAKRLTQDQLKEFTVALVQKDYIQESTVRRMVGGYSRTWTVFAISPMGSRVLQDTSLPIMLPVPHSIRKAEQMEEEKRQRVLKELESSGVNVADLPQEEVEQGDGVVIRAYRTWNRKMASLEVVNKERAAELQDLLKMLQDWRLEAASRLQLSPASVLPEHVLYSLAYSVQTFPTGMVISKNELMSVGARTKEIDSLVDVVNSWTSRVTANQSVATSDSNDAQMVFEEGNISPVKKWHYAVYKPQKKTGLASWESSYLRFQKGESPTTISMTRESGRSLALSTVIGHIQEGFIHGREVDLARLASYSSLPTKLQWAQLMEAESTTGIDVAGDPATCGRDGETYKMTDLLRPIMGESFADTPYNERLEADKQRFGSWCDLLKWYQLMKRTGVEPKFASSGSAS